MNFKIKVDGCSSLNGVVTPDNWEVTDAHAISKFCKSCEILQKRKNTIHLSTMESRWCLLF